MKAFVVALPLFDKDMVVRAYRLCDRSGMTALDMKNDFRSMAGAFESPGLDMVEKLGTKPFAGDNPLFIDINKMQLMAGILSEYSRYFRIEPTSVVCCLPANLPQNDEFILAQCQKLKTRSFRLALDGYPATGLQTPLTAHMDYIFLNNREPGFSGQYSELARQMPGVPVVVADIPDKQTFRTLSGMPGGLFSGTFYSQPITEGARFIAPIKINALQLLKQVNDPDFELEDAAAIIQRDPSLSISLLRFINSEAVGISRQVKSIHAAVAILGQEEMRRWATVAISMSLADDSPSEITKLSLVRAKFAENLAGAFELGVFQQSLFLAGLFSLLDVILDKPMDQAIAEVAVDNRVRAALVDKSGDLYKVLELIYTYERADWDRVSIQMIQHGIELETVTDAFVGALVWYDQLLTSIDLEENEEEAEEVEAAT